jgi:hypothetical protein
MVADGCRREQEATRKHLRSALGRSANTTQHGRPSPIPTGETGRMHVMLGVE